MTSTEALQQHLQLCEELHQLALEENRFLKQHARLPDSALLDRKRALLNRLETSLAQLKAPPAADADASPDQAARRDTIAKAQAKILQILHLDRENEQWLLRYSLGPARTATPPPVPPAPQLQKLYDRHG